VTVLAPDPWRRSPWPLMPPAKHPQREMLRRLLDSGKLAPSEAKTVRKLIDDIVAGCIGGLSHPQAVWAAQLCKKCGVAAQPAVARDNQSSRKKAKDEHDRILADFDAMPRPKRPPERR